MKKRIKYKKGGPYDDTEFNDNISYPALINKDIQDVKASDSELYQNDRNSRIINDLQVADPTFNYYQAWKDNGEPSLNRFNTDRSYYNRPTNTINMSTDSPHMFQEEIGHALQNKEYNDGSSYRQFLSNTIYRKPETPHDRNEFFEYNEDGLHLNRLIGNIINSDYNKELRHPSSYMNRVNKQYNYPDSYFKSATTGIVDKGFRYKEDPFVQDMVNEQQKLRSIDGDVFRGFYPMNYAENKIYDITQPMSYHTYGNVENENHNYIQPYIIEPKYNISNQKANAWDTTIKSLMNLKQQ